MATWPEPLTITLVGGMIVSIIGTIVTGVVTIITALRVTEVSKVQDIQRGDIGTMAKDTEAIKGHVNSEKTASEGREASMRKEIELLRDQLADEKVTKRLLAQAHALVPALASTPPVPPTDVLTQIETNTADTAKNTAR